MTPDPPSSSDGSQLPPRHRPNIGSLSKDTTESDLWSFDDPEIAEAADASPVAAPAEPSPPPAARSRVMPKPRAAVDAPTPKAHEISERVQVNVSKARKRPQSNRAVTAAPASKAGSEFDDLDNWDDPVPSAAKEKAPEKVAEELPVLTSAVPELEFESEPPAIVEFSSTEDRPIAAPLSPRPKLNLSKVERIGLISLLVVLLVGAISLVVFVLNRLPTESKAAKANDFPIKGQNLTVASATSYWRAPILEGKNPDTFRRGTVLLPVINLAISDGSGALRLVFRNQDGESVGDIVSRSVQNGQKLEIAATAGFDDMGMHAAYRTGESKPWTIEVYEAPTVDAATKDFRWLFKMNISTDRR